MSRWICLDFVIVLWNLGLETSASLRQSEVKEIIIGHVELTLIFLLMQNRHLRVFEGLSWTKKRKLFRRRTPKPVVR